MLCASMFLYFQFAPLTIKAQERPVVAVVLSGGGAKGVAHIGALKVIEEAGIPIDIICGTSMGALVGGLYSIGYSPLELDSIVRAQDWGMLLSDRIDPDLLNLKQREEQNTYALIRGLASDRPMVGGLIRGRNLMMLFRQLCAGYLDSISFDSLPVRYACVATDLVTNGEIDFHGGSLTRAMRASMAIPGVFTPVRLGDMVLVDGGLTNNYPADLARAMGADIIIGVNVQNAPRTADDISGAGAVMNQIIDINSRNKYEENAAISDVFIKVDVTGYSAASFTPSAIDSLLSRGEWEARKHTDELRALKQRCGSRGPKAREKHPALAEQQQQQAKPALEAASIVGIPIARVGFRFDSEEMGTLQLGASLPLHLKGTPVQIDALMRLGYQFKAAAALTLYPNGFTSPQIGYTFRRNNFDIYSEGRRTYNFLYFHHQLDITPLNSVWGRWAIKAGIRWDYFDYFGHVMTADTAAPDVIRNLADENHILLRATAVHNSENHWYFPTTGIRARLAYSFIAPGNISDIAAHWRINFPVASNLAFQTMVYGRMLFGNEVPLAYRNTLGAEWFGGYVEQQMPFDGMHHIEYVSPYFLAARVQAQYSPASNHYFQVRVSLAVTSEDPNGPEVAGRIFGMSACYFYNTFFGPAGITLGSNTTVRRPVLYVTLGHKF